MYQDGLLFCSSFGVDLDPDPGREESPGAADPGLGGSTVVGRKLAPTREAAGNARLGFKEAEWLSNNC